MNIGTYVTGNTTQTNNAVIEKYCYNDSTAICNTDGGLYQWAEAMQYKDGCSNTTAVQPTEPVQGICPTGWHVPKDIEFNILIEGLATLGCGSSPSSGCQCSPAGSHLSSYTLNGDNSSGFSALITGNHHYGGWFENRNVNAAFFWTSLTQSATVVYTRCVSISSAAVCGNAYNKLYGFTVRCIKD
jgi:uncharacterized protein (TIGR02145 family)